MDWAGINGRLGSAGTVDWSVYLCPFHVVWTSSQHGGLSVVRVTWQFKAPGVCVPEKKENYMTFDDLASEVLSITSTSSIH